MHVPSITAFYLAILALHLRRARAAGRATAAGQPRAVRRRRQHGLRSAIRAHANFIEYVPIIMLMVALLEMSGMPAMRVHLLMGALLVARLLHPLGMYVAAGHLQFQIGRVGGILAHHRSCCSPPRSALIALLAVLSRSP